MPFDHDQYVASMNVDPAAALTNANARQDFASEYYTRAPQKDSCPKCGETVRVINGQTVAFHTSENGERCFINYKRAVAAGAITRQAAMDEGWDGLN